MSKFSKLNDAEHTDRVIGKLATSSYDVYNEMLKQMLYEIIDERGMRIHQLERKLRKMNRKSASQHRVIAKAKPKS
jgi:hypothetical protein